MTHPIQPRIGSVFIPVTDLARSTRFYSTVLGLPIDPEIQHEHLHWFPLANNVDLVLDSKIQRPNDTDYPLFFFGATDIDAAFRALTEQGVEVEGEIQRGPVSFFTFRDPDRNLLMICDCPPRNQ